MRKISDIVAEFHGVVLIHQKIPAHIVGRHRHSEHEFFLPLQGEIAVSYSDEKVKAGPGRMLYVPPDLDHDFSASAQGSGERVICLITKNRWKKHVDAAYRPCAMPINTLAKELVFYLLIHQKAQGVQYFVSALIESFADSLSAGQLERQIIFTSHMGGKAADVRIQNAIKILDEEMASVTLAEIAKRSGLSPRNFNRLFLKECGLNPKDYLILRKIEYAKKLLKESRLTVTDISLEVGYLSLSRFISTFKKITGMLPSDFRNGP